MLSFIFIAFAANRGEVGYEPLTERMPPQYYNYILFKRINTVYRKHGDHICTNYKL